MNTEQYFYSAWSWSPVVIGVCLAAGIARLVLPRARATKRIWLFYGGLAVLFLTLASPLNALADGFLFSAHMLQHMLLLLIVPLLLLLGLPGPNADEPSPGRRFHMPPKVGWLAGVGAMWVWHERTLCDLATRTETFRDFQIVSLLAFGALFWWPLFGPRADRRISPLGGVVYLFSACVTCSVLGILITFSPLGAVCPVYLNPPNRPELLGLIRDGWGFTPAKDQQIGGLLMWVPGCGIYLAGVLAMLARWYGSEETESGAAGPPNKPERARHVPVTAVRAEGN